MKMSDTHWAWKHLDSHGPAGALPASFMRHQPIGGHACAIWLAGESARSQPGTPLWPFPGAERARDAGRMKTTGTSAQAAQTTSLCKTYGAGQAAERALRDVNATFERGLFTAVMGRRAGVPKPRPCLRPAVSE